MDKCPHCNSVRITKFGKTRKGTQKYYCKDCERTFCDNSRVIFKNDKIVCPTCSGMQITKKGTTKFGTQKYYCKDCGKRFCVDGKDRSLTKEEKIFIIRYVKCLGLPVKDVANHLKRGQTTIRMFLKNLK